MASSSRTSDPASHTTQSQSPMETAISSGFSTSSRNTLISTTVIGGTFVIALIIYVLYKRRRGKTYAQILRMPPKRPETPQLSPTSMREKFWKHPIYHEVDYSVRSSRLSSTVTFPPRARLGSHSTAGRPKHQRIKSNWKDPDLPTTPTTPAPKTPVISNKSTFFLDKSPEQKPRTPAKAHDPTSHDRDSPPKKKDCTTIVETEPFESEHGADDNDDFHSALASPPLLNDSPDRWSWTNSQAPSTPRLLPKTRRASLASTRYSAPRFKSVRSWALGQEERLRINEDDAPPLLPTPDLLPAFSGKHALKDRYASGVSGRSSQRSGGSKGGNGQHRHVRNSPSRGKLTTLFFSSAGQGSRATPRDLESGIEMRER